MATKTLVINGDDKQHFFLSLNGGTLTVGNDPAHPESVLHGLHVRRIRCEIEVEDDAVSLDDFADASDGGPPSSMILRPGDAVHVGHTELRLSSPLPPVMSLAPDDTKIDVPLVSLAPVAAPTPSRPVVPVAPVVKSAGPALRLRVVDGADQGRCFPIPPAGTVTVGKSTKHADIVLHDLYVARIHCELAIENGTIVVSHIEGEGGTRVDGATIEGPTAVGPGSVVRVGNSHLRIEHGPVESVLDEGPAVGHGSGYAPPSGTRLTTTVGGTHATAVARKSSDPLAELEGRTFGTYRFGTPTGRGHTGTVFQAEDLRTNQPVVVKVLLGEFPAGQSELDRFAKAMTTAAQVHHPNLITMYGGGRTAGHCWIAREFVDGEGADTVVQRILDGERASWTRACRVAVHLGRAIEAVHAHRLVHGNITPKNVVIRHADNAAKLTDLLLAQALDGSKLRQLVVDKKLAAELPYLAPEQTEAGAFVDQLADLYAVGAVVYALLAGRPPFSGETRKDVIAAIQAGRVTKPTSFHKKVPTSFEAVVLKLLARHQEDRYQTATAMLRDVEAVAEEHDIKV